jgi:hypothetical protein
MDSIITVLDDEVRIAPLDAEEGWPDDDPEDMRYCACAGDWSSLPCSCHPDVEALGPSGPVELLLERDEDRDERALADALRLAMSDAAWTRLRSHRAFAGR